MNTSYETPLHAYVKTAVTRYFATIEGEEDPTGLYELFLAELEKPLIEATLRHTRGNQSRTANMLGLNRGTLRSKMKKYGLL